MFNPCCCVPLQRGTSIFAVVDAVFNALAIILYGILLVGVILINPEDPEHGTLTHGEKVAAIVISSLLIVSCIFQLYLAVFLRRAAREKSYRNLRIWLIVTIVIYIFGVANTIFSIHSTGSALSWSSGMLGVLYKLYEIWVVTAFMFEVRAEDQNTIQSGP